MTPPNRLGSGLQALGASILALVCARAELIAIELQEQRARAEQKLVLAVLGALFLAMGLQLAAFLAVLLFWDAYRMVAAGGITVFYLGIGVWALVRLREMTRDSPPPFAAAMGEFGKDLRLMRGLDE